VKNFDGVVTDPFKDAVTLNTWLGMDVKYEDLGKRHREKVPGPPDALRRAIESALSARCAGPTDGAGGFGLVVIASMLVAILDC